MRKLLHILYLSVTIISWRTFAFQVYLNTNKKYSSTTSLNIFETDPNLYYNAKENIWAIRRKLVRTCLKPEAVKRIEKENNPKPSDEEKKAEKTKMTLAVSAFLITVGAAVFRLGGRAAFVQLLGLDFIANQDLKTQIDSLLSTFESFGNLRYIGFLGCWIAAKTLCIDAAALVLALSSGVLFGGIVEGTIISVICSSLASLVPFLLARTVLREKAEEEIAKRPAWRAIDKVVSKDGLKKVFVLRLSPLLPIPIGAYNYLYGATSVSIQDFLLGLTTASIKPYFLDSYLGVYGKSIMDGETGQNDLLFAGVILVLVLVGTFSTQIAEATFQEIKKETELSQQLNNTATTNTVTTTTTTISNSMSAENTEWNFMGVKMNPPSGLISILNELKAANTRIEIMIEDEWQTIQTEVKADIYDEMDAQINWDGIKLPYTPLPSSSIQSKLSTSNKTSSRKNEESVMSASTPMTRKSAVQKTDKDRIDSLLSSSSLVIYENEDINSYISSTMTTVLSPTKTQSVTTMSRIYPGQRYIQSYENTKVTAETVKEYTYESILFGWCLISAFTKIAFFDEDHILPPVTPMKTTMNTINTIDDGRN